MSLFVLDTDTLVLFMDLRIAAITVEHAGTLVTRNTRDFQRISGLAIEDWSV